MKTKGK